MEETKTKNWVEDYRQYPDTQPDGFATFHQSRVLPIAYEIPEGSKVLDIGANSGEFMLLLKEKRNCKVYGVDVSDVAIAAAKEKGLDVINCDAAKLPFEDASFDVVVLMEVLSHLADTASALKEIRRVLKPSGFLLGSAPHANLERFIWDDKRMHQRYYEEPSLRDALEKEFPFTFVRTLTGAQFAVSMAPSFLADKPAEMLFKCGGTETTDWEADQQSSTLLRVWFGPTQLMGTTYYRMLGFAEKMDQAGLIQAAYERAPWDQMDERTRAWQARIRNKVVLNQLENILRVAHVSVWQMTASRDVLAFLRCAKDLANGAWFKATGDKKAFVTEIDDDLFDVPSGNVASNPYQPNSEAEWIAQKQIELSDALICSTQFLLDKMQAMFPGKPAFLIPNSLDFDIWDNLVAPEIDFPKKEDGWLRIGYTGCSNHRKDLEMIREPLCAILHEFKNVQFLFTPQPEPGGIFMGWEGVPNMGLVQKWVNIDKYPHFLKAWDLDIGIAPLKDNDFNRAKSNLRWLEYSGLKIPTVASRVYPFRYSIKDAEDGLICNTSQQWYDALKGLILDAQRRKTIGEAAYQRVRRDFNMDTTARRYAEILSEIKCNAQTWKPKSDDSSAIPTIPAGQPALSTSA